MDQSDFNPNKHFNVTTLQWDIHYYGVLKKYSRKINTYEDDLISWKQFVEMMESVFGEDFSVYDADDDGLCVVRSIPATQEERDKWFKDQEQRELLDRERRRMQYMLLKKEFQDE